MDRFVGTQTTIAARAIYSFYVDYIIHGKSIDKSFWKQATDIMNKNSDVQKLKGISNRINRLTSDEFIAWNGRCIPLLKTYVQTDLDSEIKFWRAAMSFLPCDKMKQKSTAPGKSRS